MSKKEEQNQDEIIDEPVGNNKSIGVLGILTGAKEISQECECVVCEHKNVITYKKDACVCCPLHMMCAVCAFYVLFCHLRLILHFFSLCAFCKLLHFLLLQVVLVYEGTKGHT